MATTIDSTTTDRIYAAVALVAAVLSVVEGRDPLWAVGCLLVALVPSALIALRRSPPPGVVAAVSVLPLVPLIIVVSVGAAVFMSTAAASRFASRVDDLRAVVVVTAAVVALPFLCLLSAQPDLHAATYFAFGDVFGVLVGVLLRREQRLAARLRKADAELAEAGQREERQRVARDVHDLVAHSLTVVVLHIGGARRVLRADPGAAESALADAERVCRESLDGIRGVVGLLRDTDAPQGVSLDLDALVATYRTAGADVELRADVDGGTLPLATRVVLYRVVQESLANAARYAPAGGRTTVEIDSGDDAVTIRVVNPLAGGPVRRGRSGGYGLAGLREQVAAADGLLTSGPDGDRWVVACRLPVARAAVPAAAAGGDR